MRAREFITEQAQGSLQDEVAATLPATYVLTKLQNQDPYLQYRFGVAIAGAKGRRQRAKDQVPEFHARSAWGENQVVVSYDPNIEEWIDDALADMNMSPRDKRLISTASSDEPKHTSTQSPIRAFKGYPR